MRTRMIGLSAALSVVVLGAPSIGVAAAPADPGTYLTPFREDGAHFVAGQFQAGTYFGQPTDDSGCVAKATPNAPQGYPLAYRCMPAGASVVELPDGRILYWDALEGTENLAFGSTDSTVTDFGRLSVNDESRILRLGGQPSWSTPSPADGGAANTSTAEDLPLPPPLSATHYAYNSASLFCSDQVILGDGRVLDAGGTDYYSEPTVPMTGKGVVELEGVRNTRLFDPATDRWEQAAAMNHGRWYPSLVTLGNGDVFVASGVTKLIKPVYPGHPTDSGTNVEQTETYDPVTNVWTDNGTAANRSLPLFPRLHLLPDGHVYYDAAGQDFNPAGQSYDEALWNVAGSYDPSSKSWHDLGIPGLLSPGAGPATVGFRGSTFSAALQLRPDAQGHYARASFLTAGGVLLPSPGSVVPVADSRIDTVTTDASGNERLSVAPAGPLLKARWYGSAVPLPDGTVYAVSGADLDEVVAPGMESPITEAERFVPTLDATGSYTGGSWEPAGAQARKRTYHNTAILLPDGSVLIGGHAPIPALYNQVMDGVDLPGRPGTDNHHDASFQIYRPPYFAQPRPTITGVSASPGGDLVIQTPDPAAVVSVVVVRNAAVTHLVDGDGRTVQLPIVARGANTVVARLPASSDVLPAGPYLLFVNRSSNAADPADAAPGHVVPSIGVRVFFRGTSRPALFSAAAPAVVPIPISGAHTAAR